MVSFWGLAASNYRRVALYLVLEKAQSKWVECIHEFLAVSFRDLRDGWVTSATPSDPNHMFYVLSAQDISLLLNILFPLRTAAPVEGRPESPTIGH